MDHFVDEKPLPHHALLRKIIAICGAHRVEMDVPSWGHRHCPGLKRKPLLTSDPNFGVVDRRPEHGLGEGDFARRKRPFAAHRAEVFTRSLGINAQRASPAARISAGKLYLSPPETISVTSVVPPGFNSGDTPMAIM